MAHGYPPGRSDQGRLRPVRGQAAGSIGPGDHRSGDEADGVARPVAHARGGPEGLRPAESGGSTEAHGASGRGREDAARPARQIIRAGAGRPVGRRRQDGVPGRGRIDARLPGFVGCQTDTAPRGRSPGSAFGSGAPINSAAGRSALAGRHRRAHADGQVDPGDLAPGSDRDAGAASTAGKGRAGPARPYGAGCSGASGPATRSGPADGSRAGGGDTGAGRRCAACSGARGRTSFGARDPGAGHHASAGPDTGGGRTGGSAQAGRRRARASAAAKSGPGARAHA